MNTLCRRLVLVFFALFALCGIAACGGAAASTPRIRVARDLGCAPEETSIGRLDASRWRVTGCGRTAVYLCTYPVRDCWREGEVQQEVQVPTAQR